METLKIYIGIAETSTSGLKKAVSGSRLAVRTCGQLAARVDTTKRTRRYREVDPKTETTPGLEITTINQLWHVDITYVPTDEGWLYLAGVIDGFSKRVVGYAMTEHMRTDLVMQALRAAVKRRKPAAGLIHHSDRGSQYASRFYQKELVVQGMLPSFTGKGACFDNAVIESFWATLKRELVYSRESFATRDEARSAIFEFMEVY